MNKMFIYGGIRMPNKIFLDVNDVQGIFNCCRSKAYHIINSLNSELLKKGMAIYNGKVLASALYKKYGIGE